ncbi:hypothetical protein FITA111629_03435 [Filibacter tadaridae]|uniref:Uncharacterized protein n=1 Tax=Filibacter tadaridae TaxID=2483811 RepID=A0A3P5WVV4_9BACL|nr:hypothetical protein [Filibacter tadaridae]VDC27492.1 hypothetical protein FILTAD_01605 [Filibacter tadaridae]
MHTLNYVEIGIQNGEEIRFSLPNTAERPTGTPAGKMITDSDNVSFVYLLDEEIGYSHIYFKQDVWPYMVKALQAEKEPILFYGEESMVLVGFKEELMMLIYNIEGNDNYGEAFSTAVEQAFNVILQQVD